MRLLLVASVLALAVLLASAEPGFDGMKKLEDLKKGATKLFAPKSTRSSTSGSGSGSSSHPAVKPELMAKEIVAVFGDADGSAYFKGNKILPHSVAEVPPRKKSPSRPHGSRHGSRSAESHRFREPIADQLKQLGKPKPPPSRRPPPPPSRSGSGRTHSRSSATNPRHRRPLFNFNSVPNGVTGVGLRKHNFGTKHHNLLVRFCNSHPKVTTVIVVDKFVGPNGRPAKKGSSGDRRRGNKQSDLKIVGLKHKNLFVFNDKLEKVFPAKGSQSGSSKGSHSGSTGSGKATPPPRPSSPPSAPKGK